MKHEDCVILKQKISQLLDAYQMREAKKLLLTLQPTDVFPDLRNEFAQFARRLGLFKYAVKVLWSSIYQEKKYNDSDILEFAASIRGLGLVNQSLNLLSRVSDQPNKFLYCAYGLINKWDYKNAAIFLEKYIAQPNISEKQIIVAKLNLASCYVATLEFENALEIVAKIENLAREKYIQLYLNSQEIKGQIYIQQKRFSEAHQVLNYAREKSENEIGNTSLFIKKWHILLDCYEGKLAFSDDKIFEFKKTIRTQKHWETLRDFDLHVGLAFKNNSLVNHVYFGSPHEAYKERIKKLSLLTFYPNYIWINQVGTNNQAYGFDSFEKIKSYPEGMLLHRLLLVLLSDFYRPWGVGRIFDSLFPQSIYDPFSSPKKIYRLIEKLKNVILEDNIPLELKATKQGYRLRPQGKCYVKIKDKMIFSSREDYFIYKWKSVIGERSLLRTDIQSYFNLQQGQAVLLINKMISEGFIKAVGKGRATKYKLVS